MSTSVNGVPLSNVEIIAAQVEADMRQRGLRPGDRYLTATEVAEAFSVSSMAAHRAMRSLADRDVLTRRRSRGTYVGPNFSVSSDRLANKMDVVHLVMALDYHITQEISSDSLVDEFSRAIPGVSVQVHHLAERAASRHASELIKRIGESRREGLILIRCSQEVQSLVAESLVPAVVYGQAYPSVGLSSLAHDQAAVGRLIAQYALDRGSKRFALFTHKGWRLGDHLMVDSVMQTLAAADIRLDAVKVRSLVPERAVVAHAISEMLAGTEAMDAFLCRHDFYARVVSDVVADAGRSLRQRPCIVSGGQGVAGLNCGFKRVVSTMRLEEQVARLADLLVEAAASCRKPRTVTVPVVLCDSFVE